MARLRIVLDTNVLVSGFAYPNSTPGRIVDAWQQGNINVALSHFILDEMARVLPKLSRVGFTANEIRDFVDSLAFIADIIEPDAAFEPGLRDPADQPVLATFRAAQAEYLVTGDKDLLVLADQFPIITPAEFWQRHG